jgi:dsDNA-specific endonuclease/ATPase MutS2
VREKQKEVEIHEPGGDAGLFQFEVTDVLDLHTFAPRDVKAVVEEYLAEAHRLGFRALRIVHGRGIGVQREMVRSVLARTPFVTAFRDAPMEAGGWGATIVDMGVDIGGPHAPIKA